MTEQRRKIVLTVVAVALVGLLGSQALLPGGPQAANSPTAGGAVAPVGSKALPGAPPGLTRPELAKRYTTVLDAGLFIERSFKERPKNAPKPKPRRPVSTEPSEPAGISLRLTGVLGEGDARCGVLEERGTGKGLVAATGLEIGDAKVTGVSTTALVLERAGKREEIPLGEVLTLPASARSALTQLKVTTKAAKKPSAGSTPAVEISSDKRMSILEKLKAARQKSMDKKKDSK